MGRERIVIGDLVLTEVLQGCVDSRRFEETRRLFGRFDFVVLGGHQVAVQAARNYLHLRSLGFTIRKTIDTIIATKCILSDFRLLHNDRDFLPFEKYLGLKTVIPVQD
jgi:predicted nucleic acid-binding protein